MSSAWNSIATLSFLSEMWRLTLHLAMRRPQWVCTSASTAEPARRRLSNISLHAPATGLFVLYCSAVRGGQILHFHHRWEMVCKARGLVDFPGQPPVRLWASTRSDPPSKHTGNGKRPGLGRTQGVEGTLEECPCRTRHVRWRMAFPSGVRRVVH